jgi:hypothetical protein
MVARRWWPYLQRNHGIYVGEDRLQITAESVGVRDSDRGAITFVPDIWIGLPSLALLIVINGLATGTNLVNDSQENRLPEGKLPKGRMLRQ